jgi:glycosyltransferase involved in cell wall biosynthesis
MRRLVYLTLARADAVVTLGRFWQAFFCDTVSLTAERVVVIPNGVVDPGPPPERATVGPCRLLFVGRLGERKGTPVLLEALADARLAALDWTLTLAGDGEVAAMSDQAARLGLANRCRFTGWVDQATVASLMRDCDVLVLPSHQEGLPMAILEAMAHGLAIATTGAGSIGDAVTDGENGLLTTPGDSHALGAALYRLVVEPDWRRGLQRAARARFERDYAAPLFVDRFAELYHRLLSAAQPAAFGTAAASAVDRHDPAAPFPTMSLDATSPGDDR